MLERAGVQADVWPGGKLTWGGRGPGQPPGTEVQAGSGHPSAQPRIALHASEGQAVFASGASG